MSSDLVYKGTSLKCVLQLDIVYNNNGSRSLSPKPHVSEKTIQVVTTNADHLIISWSFYYSPKYYFTFKHTYAENKSSLISDEYSNLGP